MLYDTSSEIQDPVDVTATIKQVSLLNSMNHYENVWLVKTMLRKTFNVKKPTTTLTLLVQH